MDATIIPILRRGAAAVGWLLLAIIGFLAFMAVAWVPPELAAMLGSRAQGRGPRPTTPRT